MSSTYSPSLRIELIPTGDQAGTWGNTTNTNLGTLMESAIAGYTSVSVTSANQAFLALNGAADEARNLMIALTTTTGAPFSVYAPPAEKSYVIYNASAFAATIFNSTVIGNTTAAGVGVVIPPGRTIPVWSDGTNFRVQVDHLQDLSLTTPLPVASGGTGASTAGPARTNLGLGTLATQNANSVSITGGSVTGITDLAIADGGTAASDAATARTNLDVPSRTGSGASGTWGISVTGNAATATTATTASSVAWTNVSGRPTAVSAFTNDSGYITTAGRAFPRRSDGADINFVYTGQSGQPLWVWGTNNGTDVAVWQPSTLNVNFANTAGTANSVSWGNVFSKPTLLQQCGTFDSGYLGDGANGNRTYDIPASTVGTGGIPVVRVTFDSWVFFSGSGGASATFNIVSTSVFTNGTSNFLRIVMNINGGGVKWPYNFFFRFFEHV